MSMDGNGGTRRTSGGCWLDGGGGVSAGGGDDGNGGAGSSGGCVSHGDGVGDSVAGSNSGYDGLGGGDGDVRNKDFWFDCLGRGRTCRAKNIFGESGCCCLDCGSSFS